MIKGIMFDFSGTLFRVEPTARWLGAVATAAGVELTAEELADGARRLQEYGALPGGAEPRVLPAELVEAWETRDLSAARHRAAYAGLARAAGSPGPELADALYDRHLTPEAWQPYPDTEPVLRELRRRGLPVAVVSNIGWDLRPVFRAHGLDELVDAYLLSYEVGVQKPDPVIFEAACDRLGLAPSDVLMVGDSRAADGGAAALGCPFLPVDHLPVDRRPNGLTPLLDLLS
ncbi:HAD-IA family hydrolase [Kitasatospora kifunensis]|uniref:Putative hydrolase of the HAD superfamily n=1 Tax=Kitasatospora kifunensis TaxID=58351 RepID=A0A7W7R6Z4_KITKI|nr:HAD-IA family hydrolase [Kitasatospora kifunensis]MBB4926568.1 putative hydrolase of the HAD superfamily [Kitasatospora kifunensis]